MCGTITSLVSTSEQSEMILSEMENSFLEEITQEMKSQLGNEKNS